MRDEEFWSETKTILITLKSGGPPMSHSYPNSIAPMTAPIRWVSLSQLQNERQLAELLNQLFTICTERLFCGKNQPF